MNPSLDYVRGVYNQLRLDQIDYQKLLNAKKEALQELKRTEMRISLLVDPLAVDGIDAPTFTTTQGKDSPNV